MGKVSGIIATVGCACVLLSLSAATVWALEWLANGAKIIVALAADGVSVQEYEDMKTGTTLLCEQMHEGTVGPGGAGKMTKINSASCTVDKGICGSPQVSGVDLPWEMELGSTRLAFSREGWEFVCFGFVEDVCEGKDSVAVENTETGLVDYRYDESSEGMSCTIGGAAQGLVRGSDTILLVSGEALTTS